MPVVPRLDAPQVSPGVLPLARQSANATPASFGGIQAVQAQQMGQGLSSLGHTVNAIATDIQERENAALVLGAETALKDAYTTYEAEARKRKGAQAWGLTQETDKWFADQGKEHAQTLTNDRQRFVFGQIQAKLRTQAMGNMAAYESGERDRTLAESARSSIATNIKLGAAAAADGLIAESQIGSNAAKYTDENGTEVAETDAAAVGGNPIPGLIRENLRRIDVLADLEGWSPERRELEANRATTLMHKEVLNALADSDAKLAKTYYEEHKTEIDGDERGAIEKVLKIGGIRAEAQEAVEAIFTAGMGEKEALAHVRNEYEGELEDEIVQRVKARFAEGDQLREQGQRRAADVAWKTYSQRQRLEDIPASVIAAMDGRDIENLRKHAADAAAGITAKTDPETYYGLRTMAATDPAAFQALDLRRYINVLSPSDFQEFVKLQTGTSDDIKDAATLTQQLSNTHDLLGFDSGDGEKKGLLDKAVTDAVNAEQRRLGKKLNYDERQAIIDRMLIEGDVSRGFFNDQEGRFYESAVTPQGAANFHPEIPDTDRAQIEEKFMQKHNRKPTDDEVEQTFKIWKGLR